MFKITKAIYTRKYVNKFNILNTYRTYKTHKTLNIVLVKTSTRFITS